jgi:ABC-type multidrug transport system ATPase subunit
MDDNKLVVKDLCVTYKRTIAKGEVKEVKALSNLNIEFNNPSSVVGVVAQNGGGKTTLFKTILGSEKPTSGKVTLNGKTPRQFSMNYYR